MSERQALTNRLIKEIEEQGSGIGVIVDFILQDRRATVEKVVAPVRKRYSVCENEWRLSHIMWGANEIAMQDTIKLADEYTKDGGK